MSKPSSSHPLLRLVDTNKNSLKCALVKYIDVTVEKQFGQFRNQIMELIESGDIVLRDVNASNNDDDDDYSEDDGESISDYAECEDCVKGICGLVGENGDNADNRVSKKVDTQIGLRQDAQPNGSLANGDLIPDAIDDSNQSVHNVNDNLNNVAITTSIQRQNTQHLADDEEDVNGEYQQNNTSMPSSAFYSNDQITLPPTNTASMESDLIPDVIDDSNQSANDNASNDLYTLNNESEKQIRTVHKSKKNVPKQQKSVQSVQPVIEHDQQSIASTSSERRSSGRKRIPTKLYFNNQSCGQLEKNKRKSTTELCKSVKKAKPGTGNDDTQGDDDNEDDDGIEVPEKSGKEKVVTLELNCPEPGCKATLDTISMWHQHLSTVHGLVSYKQLEDNVRQTQRGKWEYPCTDCASVCKNQMSIIVHWRTYHQAGKFKCTGCEFVGNLRNDVLKHQRNFDHSTNWCGTEVGNATEKVVILKLDCIDPGCKAILNTLEMWKQHLSTVHGQMQPYKQLKDNVQPNQHGKLEYVCTECVVVRSSLESISGHWRQNHQKGKFKCCDCEFVSNLRQEVYQHRRKTNHKKDKDSLNRREEL